MLVQFLRRMKTSNATSDFSTLSKHWPQLSTTHTPSNPVNVDIAMSIISQSFSSSGSEPYFGEPVTHEEHALQCATLAQTAGFNEDVIVAAFLHDIGHICAPDDAPHMDTDGGKDVGVVDHESIGKELLQLLGFSTFVTDLVESHVPSKRYLVSIDKEYRSGLAEDSKRSLIFQGGIMTKDEVQNYESDPEMLDIKTMFRTWDDEGKKENAYTPPIEHFLPMVKRHLNREWEIRNTRTTEEEIQIESIR